jgi:hypothetical protein
VKTVLHLTADGAQFWRKSNRQWLPVANPDQGSVWIVTDLAEETLTEIQIPRLFGRDRTNFVQRQLASRFPDTPYRAVLPAAAPSGFLERIAPRRQSLLALDARDRINEALDGIKASVAGIWTTSGLLAQFGSEKTLPLDLFLVMPNQQSIRIVFLKKRVPIISRLVRDSGSGMALATEIVRTLRHLENTKVLDRDGSQRSVMILGLDNHKVGELEAEQFTLIQPPRSWRKMTTDDFKFALFELAMRFPAGQLAPLSRRTAFVASQIRKAAYALSAATVCASVWLLTEVYSKMQADRALLTSTRDSIKQTALELSKTDKKIAAYAVPSDIFKNALKLERDQILAAPAMDIQLQWLSAAIADPALRLSRLDWAVDAPPTTPCSTETTANQSPPVASVQPAVNENPKFLGSRISFDLSLPPGLETKSRLALIESVSDRLKKIPGVTLQQYPARALPGDSLVGGIRKPASTEAAQASWCIVIAGGPVNGLNVTLSKP